MEAVRLLRQIEGEERAATKEEQKILARYVGWGGIPQAFDNKNESWKKEYMELKDLLSGKEYEAARDSVNTAFYTDPVITGAVYEALEKLGFKGCLLYPSTMEMWGLREQAKMQAEELVMTEIVMKFH